MVLLSSPKAAKEHVPSFPAALQRAELWLHGTLTEMVKLAQSKRYSASFSLGLDSLHAFHRAYNPTTPECFLGAAMLLVPMHRAALSALSHVVKNSEQLTLTMRLASSLDLWIGWVTKKAALAQKELSSEEAPPGLTGDARAAMQEAIDTWCRGIPKVQAQRAEFHFRLAELLRRTGDLTESLRRLHLSAESVPGAALHLARVNICTAEIHLLREHAERAERNATDAIDLLTAGNVPREDRDAAGELLNAAFNTLIIALTKQGRPTEAEEARKWQRASRLALRSGEFANVDAQRPTNVARNPLPATWKPPVEESPSKVEPDAKLSVVSLDRAVEFRRAPRTPAKE